VVKKAAWLMGEYTQVAQPDSHPGKLDGVWFGVAFVVSCSAFFTIRASRMGSLL
jgi:hypothetical protein